MRPQGQPAIQPLPPHAVHAPGEGGQNPFAGTAPRSNHGPLAEPVPSIPAQGGGAQHAGAAQHVPSGVGQGMVGQQTATPNVGGGTDIQEQHRQAAATHQALQEGRQRQQQFQQQMEQEAQRLEQRKQQQEYAEQQRTLQLQQQHQQHQERQQQLVEQQQKLAEQQRIIEVQRAQLLQAQQQARSETLAMQQRVEAARQNVQHQAVTVQQQAYAVSLHAQQTELQRAELQQQHERAQRTQQGSSGEAQGMTATETTTGAARTLRAHSCVEIPVAQDGGQHHEGQMSGRQLQVAETDVDELDQQPMSQTQPQAFTQESLQSFSQVSTVPPATGTEYTPHDTSQATTEQYTPGMEASTHMESMVTYQGSMEESMGDLGGDQMPGEDQMPQLAQPEPEDQMEEEPQAKRRAMTPQDADSPYPHKAPQSQGTPETPLTPQSCASRATSATTASSSERPQTRAWVKGLPKTSDPPGGWTELSDAMGASRGLRGGRTTSMSRVPSVKTNRDQPYDTRNRRAKEVQASREAAAAAASASAIVEKDW